MLDDKPALGDDAAEIVIGNLQGANIAAAYGTGLGLVGTGAYGGGTGDPTLGVGTLGTLGKFGPGDGSGEGPGRGYGVGVGKLRTRQATVPQIIPGVVTSQGALDKEIIRRIVRRHVNEVKYCYDQALVRQPKLDGRLVVKFTIAGTGQVLASVVQSSTLGVASLEFCVVNASGAGSSRRPNRAGW